MKKQPMYPVGSKVRIKDPGKIPSNWNGHMMMLVGRTAFVVKSERQGIYRYRLDSWDWSWRHCDLELVEMPKLNPNIEFRNRRYGI